MRQRASFYVFLILGAAVLELIASCSSGKGERVEPPARPAKLIALDALANAQPRHYPAKVEAIEEVELSFKVAGPLIELPIKEGNFVKKGAVLARIDPRDFEIQLTTAQNELAQTKAHEKAMKAGARPEDIKILEANYQSALSKFTKDKSLYQKRISLKGTGAISDQEIEQFEAEFKQSQSALDAAQKELEKGKAGARAEDIEAIEATVRKLDESVKNARNALDDTTLIAPYEARVMRVWPKNYQEVRAKDPIVLLQQIDRLKIVFDLPENVVFHVQMEAKAHFTAKFEALPGVEYNLELSEARLQADPSTNTFHVTMVMPASDKYNILPGMTAEVTYYIDEPSGKNSYTVPIAALFANAQGEYFVWVVDPQTQKVHATPVKVEQMLADQALVSGNVTGSETIVGAGASVLSEGDRVRQYVPAGSVKL